MFPPRLVIFEPLFITIAPAPLASKSLLSVTFRLPEVDVMVVLLATMMSLWALSVRDAAPPLVLAMLALTAMLPSLAPDAVVAMVTEVPAFRLVAMSLAKITESTLAL